LTRLWKEGKEDQTKEAKDCHGDDAALSSTLGR
jgi:hypothetical protein